MMRGLKGFAPSSKALRILAAAPGEVGEVRGDAYCLNSWYGKRLLVSGPAYHDEGGIVQQRKIAVMHSSLQLIYQKVSI